MTRPGTHWESSGRPHVLMVTNHGLHEWNVVAGLPDTGGQNIYVNYLSATLARNGFRVTISNRGGYPHPTNGRPREGVLYRGGNERIIYTRDRVRTFVRKEDMEYLTEEIAADLVRHLDPNTPPDLIISHYWDGALVASAARRMLGCSAPHVWIPHSLGTIKRRNVPKDQHSALRINERIAAEHKVLRDVDLVGTTSATITAALRDDYGFRNCAFLPPCVDPERFNPDVHTDRRAVGLLSEATGRSREEILSAPVVTEVSRTAKSKRKDLLIRAFARVRKRHANAILAVTIDRTVPDVFTACSGIIDELNLHGSVAILGSIQDVLPSLYGLTTIYCTPSVMEGFGMSIQEAAACGVPAVSSSSVPFAVEYLCGPNPQSVQSGVDESLLRVGDGAIIVEPNNVSATAAALELLLEDTRLRERMGARAANITVPYFTWDEMTARFLDAAGILLPTAGEP